MTIMTETNQRLRFVEPLPGFDDESEYTLEAIDERGLLHSLRSVGNPGLRFVLARAAAFFPDYRPDLVDALSGPLGTDDIEQLLVLSIGTGLRDATANLRAPIAVARSTGRAVQVVLEDDSLSMRQPLVSDQDGNA
jgi:flagellar assembly factor FliW